MTSNIRIIKTNIDVDPFVKELDRNATLWKMVSTMSNIGGDTNPYGFLPLVMGVQYGQESIKDSDHQQDTLARREFPILNSWLKANNAEKHSRAAFFKLEPGGRVLSHIDDGKYYLTRDRYHFCIQGEYDYTVGEECVRITPGMFFWFNNKIPHSAHSVGFVDRVTFVFDLKHSPTNP